MTISDSVDYYMNRNPVHVFEDSEIQAITQIVAALFQSAQFYTPPQCHALPQGVVM